MGLKTRMPVARYPTLLNLADDFVRMASDFLARSKGMPAGTGEHAIMLHSLDSVFHSNSLWPLMLRASLPAKIQSTISLREPPPLSMTSVFSMTRRRPIFGSAASLLALAQTLRRDMICSLLRWVPSPRAGAARRGGTGLRTRAGLRVRSPGWRSLSLGTTMRPWRILRRAVLARIRSSVKLDIRVHIQSVLSALMYLNLLFLVMTRSFSSDLIQSPVKFSVI